MSIIVSAPGKIHLLGEHAVVYGKPALLASIDKRLYVTIKKQKGQVVIQNNEGKDLVQKSISVFQKAYAIKDLVPIEIEITSQIPTGSGLGSSAALSAALIGALMKTVKNIWNPTRINELAFEVEKIAHGNPSGADNTTVVMGGLVWYRKEFDFLHSIWCLPISSYKIPRFFLIDSGKPLETTKVMVEKVAKFSQKKKNIFLRILDDQEQQTKRLLLALREGNREELTNAIRCGEVNLEEIGVVGNHAKEIIRTIEAKGGAAKVCGGGGVKKGSGMLLCYHENTAVLKSISNIYRVPLDPVILGEEGIRIEREK